MPVVFIHHSQLPDAVKTEIIAVRLVDQVPQDFLSFLHIGLFRLSVIARG